MGDDHRRGRATYTTTRRCQHKDRQKVRYRSQAAAKKALKALHSKGFTSFRSVYECKRCGGWHLTSQEAR